MIAIGIDPGIGGAIVILDYNGHPWAWSAMPSVKVGSASQVNGAALRAFLLPHFSDQAHVYLEKVGAMPGQGVTSMFNFGHSCGVALGVIVGLDFAHTLVPPATWKRKANLLGQDKDAARARAIQLWPRWRALDTKAAGQALADAALIALYSRPGAQAGEVAPIPQRRRVALR